MKHPIPHLILILTFPVLVIFGCAKSKPVHPDPAPNPNQTPSPTATATTRTFDPVDSVAGTYYGVLEEYHYSGPGSGIPIPVVITDTFTYENVVIQKVSADTFMLVTSISWKTPMAMYVNKPIRYVTGSNNNSFGSATVLFTPSIDSIYIYTEYSFYGSGGSFDTRMTFRAKK